METQKEALLSIIVPVYNSSKYISACVDSLLNQGMEESEYQIILVDDGSTDGSSEILDSYASRYSEIEVIHKSNGGVSSARNAGLDVAIGKWIAFVDSDDFLLPGVYGEIIGYMQNKGYESALLSFQEFQSEDDICPISNITFHSTFSARSSPNVWSMIILRDVIKNNTIRFNEQLQFGEDTLFSYFVWLYIQPGTQCIVNEPIYCYRQHPESVMHQKTLQSTVRHQNDMLIMAECYQSMMKRFEKKDPRYINTCYRKDKVVMAAMFDFACNAGGSPKLFIRKLREKGLFPIHFQWWTLKTLNIRTLRYNLICFLFPVPLYYYVFTYVIRKLKRKG